MKDYKLHIKMNIELITAILQKGESKQSIEESVKDVLSSIVKSEVKNSNLSSLLNNTDDIKVDFDIITEKM